MAQQIVSIGTVANDGTGDPVRTAGTKINANFTELYAAIAASGASWKSPVRAASTNNGALATTFENGDTLDGVVLVTGDRILLRNQTAAAENGIYVVAASGPPTRAADADSGLELVNAAVLVSEGTTNADMLFVCTTNAPITLGTTAVVFADMTPRSAASTTEQLTGTDATKAATSDSVAALWEQGSDVASAAIVALGEGGYFAITGTTAITDIDFATDKAGRKAWVKFAGVLILTSGANLILPTAANIVTAAGDTACFVSEGADAVRCVAYQRASGAALGAYTDAQARAAVNIAPTTQAGTAYTAALGDAGAYIQFTNAAAIAFTIPPNSAVAFAIGTVITVEQNGAGVVTLTAGAGVTLRSRGSLVATAGQYAVVQVKKVTSDIWTIIGDVT